MAQIAKKVKKLASIQLFNLKILLNGHGLSKFEKHYVLRGELGRGGFGVVYRGVRIKDDMPVAVKFIDRNQVREWGKLDDERVPMEICMLAKCVNLLGVIKLLDWYSMPEGFLIVMQRPYPCVDLFDFIKTQKHLDEKLSRFLFRQIALTIYDCAEKKVLHRDLKDENVVIDLVNGETHLIDFGAATVLKESHYSDFQGTRLYCPPEWFLHSIYLGKEAAVWSLGILLYNMLNGRLPFRSEKEICTSHLLGPLPFYVKVSRGAADLIEKCLRFDPTERISLENLIKHSWLRLPTEDWSTLTATTSHKKSSNGRHSNRVSDEHHDGSSNEESGVASASSLSSSSSSNVPSQIHRLEGTQIRRLRQPISYESGFTPQTGTTFIASQQSHESVGVYLLPPNTRKVRADKAHSMSNASHSSTLTSSFSKTPQRDSEHLWTRVRPFHQKRSVDSGQASAISISAGLPRLNNRNSLYEHNRIYAF